MQLEKVLFSFFSFLVWGLVGLGWEGEGGGGVGMVVFGLGFFFLFVFYFSFMQIGASFYYILQSLPQTTLW